MPEFHKGDENFWTHYEHENLKRLFLYSVPISNKSDLPHLCLQG